MTRDDLDVLWNRALQESVKAGEQFTRYHFADLVLSAKREALADQPAQKRPQNCGTGYCSCIECVMEPAHPQAYEKANPLGGPAKVFDAMADAIRAGDSYHAVLRQYGYAEAQQQEPVAWLDPEGEEDCNVITSSWKRKLQAMSTRLEREHAAKHTVPVYTPPPAQLKPLDAVDGDVLPPIGARVFIRHGRDDDAHACTVTGYYAWPALSGDKNVHRVFVRMVYEGTETQQARLLRDCYQTEEAAHGIKA